MTRPLFFFLAVFAFSAAGRAEDAAGNTKEPVVLECPLDPLIDIPKLWGMTPDQLEALFPQPENTRENPFFAWLTEDRSRAVFRRRPFRDVMINLSLLEKKLPVEEAVVDFHEGKLNGVTFSVFNRGDSGKISASEFKRRGALCDGFLRQRLSVTPTPRRANPEQGQLAAGWTYFSAKGLAVLEYNPESDKGQLEYLRMRLAPRDASGAIAAAIRQQRGGTGRSELTGRVEKDAEGDVFIDGIPMVDQGDKGYCVVASAQRLFEYYGISCDQHQIAQIAGTDAAQGTSSLAMMNALQKIDSHFRTRFKGLMALYTDGQLRDMRSQDPVDLREFGKQIHKYIDDGIPLLWSLELGQFPESPPLREQTSGGHMRLVIGYNDSSGQLLFSDSWGAGHELKRMKIDDAFQATHGLFVMQPTTY